MASRMDGVPPKGFQHVTVEIWEGVRKDKNEKQPVNKHKVS